MALRDQMITTIVQVGMLRRDVATDIADAILKNFSVSAQAPTPSSTPSGQGSAIYLSRLAPGDEYVVEWNDGDRQRYRVEEIRGDFIVQKRWITHLNKWTDWNGVQKISEMRRHKVEAA